jgi:hypothetical protein
MHAELSVAVEFLQRMMELKLPVDEAAQLSSALSSVLETHYAGHWHVDAPARGSAYRCLRFRGGAADPMLTAAAATAGLPAERAHQWIPGDITLWVDPGEVAFRLDNSGAMQTLYAAARTASPTPSSTSTESADSLGAASASAPASAPAPVRVPSASTSPSSSRYASHLTQQRLQQQQMFYHQQQHQFRQQPMYYYESAIPYAV